MPRFLASLLSITLLFSVWGASLPSHAQEDERTIAKPMSGRYEFEVPAEWIVDTDPASFADSGELFLPSELIWVASNDETMQMIQANEFELFEEELSGGFVLSALIPNFLINMMGSMDSEEFVTILAESFLSETDNQTITKDLELRGISGKSYQVIDAQENVWWLVLLVDSHDNILLWIGYTPSEMAEVLQESLNSLIFHDFNQADLMSSENLNMQAEILPDYATVHVPAGWWYSTTGFDNNPVLFSGGYGDWLGSTEDGLLETVAHGGLILVSATLERSELDGDIYNDDGTLSLEKVLIDEVGDDVDVEFIVWDEPSGFEGLHFSFQLPEDELVMQAEGVMLNGDAQIYIVAFMGLPDTITEQSTLINDVLNTLERVEQ